MAARIVVSGGLACLLAVAPLFAQKKTTTEGDAVFDRYRRAVENRPPPTAREIALRIDAVLPSLDKKGSMQVVRKETADRKVSFTVGEFQGDDTIKRNVIARYLRAEIEASQHAQGQSMAINRENYKYQYRGLVEHYGSRVHVFELEPRKKSTGMFYGEIWLDEETLLPLREYGVLAVSPSIFLKDIYFVRDYWIVDGKQVLRRVLSSTDVRVVGKADLTIWYEVDRFPPAPFLVP